MPPETSASSAWTIPAPAVTHYDVDLIADGIAILAKKDGGPAEHEAND